MGVQCGEMGSVGKFMLLALCFVGDFAQGRPQFKQPTILDFEALKSNPINWKLEKPSLGDFEALKQPTILDFEALKPNPINWKLEKPNLGDFEALKPNPINLKLEKPSLGDLGGGWSVGKIPGPQNVGIDANGGYIKGPSAYGINYGRDNWKVGFGANPFGGYGGLGLSFNYGK